MIQSKPARILYSILAGILIIFFWRNIGFVTNLLDIPDNSILGLSIKAFFLTLAVWILTIVVIKPKELFSFLGLSSNILKGFGIALLCVLPLYLIFPLFGELYFSWMYVEWNFNIWIPVGLHILMNGAWHIFMMEGTEVAAGGLISNIARLISIALAIGITVYYHKKSGKKVLDYPIWKV